MQINIRNNAQLANKYIRFTKWKFYRVKKKFEELLYVEVFLKSEGSNPKVYTATLRLGVPGNDIILSNKSENLGIVFQKSYQSVHRYLAKHKTLKNK